MKRHNLLATVVKMLRKDDLAIAILGATADELYNLTDRETNFYLRGAMGLASSIGLGLALTTPEKKVVVLDGDGSILMNLGSFATIASESPSNLIHIVMDNESHATVGGYPTATARKTDLTAIAGGAGITNATTVKNEEEFQHAFEDARSTPGPHVIVATVERDLGASTSSIMRLVHVKERFMRAVNRKNPNLLPP